jgi:peroxiredoxin
MLTWIGSLFLALMIVAVLVFYSLKGGLSQKEQSPTAVVQDSTNKLKLEISKTPMQAPEFELKDPAGKQISLKQLRGKVVFLNFWATWCPPCIEEMPAIEKLHQELQKDELVILAVNFQEGRERVKEFLAEHKLTFTALLDRDGKVSELYQAWALPVSVIINKRGEIAARAMGSKDWYSAEARQFFKQLSAEEPGR